MAGAFSASAFTSAFLIAAQTLAGGIAKKKRKTYIINGRRLTLSPSELDAELASLVRSKIDKPDEVLEIVQPQIEAEATKIEIKPLGIELSVILDEANRQDILSAIQRVEMENLAQWVAYKVNKREEENLLMLLLAT